MSENHDAELERIRVTLPEQPHFAKSNSKTFDEVQLRIRVERTVCGIAQQQLPEGSCITALDYLKKHIGEFKKNESVFRHIQDTLYRVDSSDAIHTASASTFFGQLYWDQCLMNALNEEDLRVLGYAALFAKWKEEIEYEVMRVGSSKLILWLQRAGLKYVIDATHIRWFERSYMKDAKQREGVGLAAFKETLLTISPWCPLPAVMAIFNSDRVKNTSIEDLTLRQMISKMPSMVDMLGIEKRRTEPQFWVGLFAPHFKAKDYANKLRVNGMIIDTKKANLEIMKAYAIKLHLSEKFKNQLLAVLQGAAAGKSISKVVVDQAASAASEQLQLLIAMVLGTSAGLFLAAQKKVVQAVAGVLRQVLF
jgi:hypothetical protein